MIQAVIFDIGSTLVHYKNPLNWQNLYKPALEFVSEKCALNLSEKNYQDAICILSEYNTRLVPRDEEVSATFIWNRIFTAWNKDKNSSYLQLCKNIFFSFFNNDCFIYDDVLPLLLYLREKNIKTGTLSDVAYGLENEYALKDIAPIFKYIDLPYTSNDVGFRKPNTKGLQMIAQKLSVDVGQIMFVGDEEKDIICANNAGAISVLIDRDEKRPEFGQKYRVSNLTELKKMIK